ncbi:MAG: hypothetical protein WBV67_15720, partial [Candidatus Cybelea sp.]
MAGRRLLLGLGSGLAAGYALARALEALRQSSDHSPAQAKDAAAYTRARRGFEVADTLRSAIGFFAFAYGPLAPCLDNATRRVPAWLRPALFFAPLSLAGAIAELPTSFVQEYSLERRFGLTDQTQRAWLGEYVKGALLSAGLTAFLATLLSFAVSRAPRRWPWLAGLGTLPLLVAGTIIVPLYVLPLFNAFEPVTGSLEERLRRLAARYGVGDAAILRMDMSRQTRKANAF